LRSQSIHPEPVIFIPASPLLRLAAAAKPTQLKENRFHTIKWLIFEKLGFIEKEVPYRHL
jgi:hypothetical protein